MAVADLQTWADQLEAVRLPILEAQVNDNTVGISGQGQTFTDWLDRHDAEILAAQTDADAAQGGANTALSTIYQTGLDSRTYTDARIQALRDELGSSIQAVEGNVTDAVQGHVDTEIAGVTPGLEASITDALAQIEARRDEINLRFNEFDSVVDDLLNVDIPSLIQRATNLEEGLSQYNGDLQLLTADFPFPSLIEGLDQMAADTGQDKIATEAALASAVDAKTLAIQAKTTAGNYASAALEYASVASGYADDALQFSQAAEVSRTAAETAQGVSETIQTEVNTAREDAEGAAASAVSAKELAVRVAARGANALSSQFLDKGWVDWNTAPVSTPNERYPTGVTWTWNLGTEDAGKHIYSPEYPSGTEWVGPTNAAAYAVEIEFELVSGSLSGAGILFDWQTNGTGGTPNRRTVPLSDMVQGPVETGKVLFASTIVVRPDPLYGAAFFHNQLYFMANYSGHGAKTAKEIKVHRISVRAATQEEQGLGMVEAKVQSYAYAKADVDGAIAQMDTELQAEIDNVSADVTVQGAAIADLQGNTSALYAMRVKAGGAAGEIELVAFEDADGGPAASAARISADDILLDGSVKLPQLAVGIGKNLYNDAQFLAGYELFRTLGSGGVYFESTGTLRSAGAPWAGATYPTIRLEQIGTATDGFFDLRPRAEVGSNDNRCIPVKPGQWYEVSAYASTHRCTGLLILHFLDKDGGGMGSETAAIGQNSGSSDNPDEWERYWVKGQVPPGAAFIQPIFRKYGTLSSSNSLMYIHKPMVAETHAEATEPAPWSPGGQTIIDGGMLKTGAMVSTNHVPGSVGWSIDTNGNAEFNSLIVRNSLVQGAVTDGSVERAAAAATRANNYVVCEVYSGPISFDEFWHLSVMGETRLYREEHYYNSNTGTAGLISHKTRLQLRILTKNAGVWDAGWTPLWSSSAGNGDQSYFVQNQMTVHYAGDHEDMRVQLLLTIDIDGSNEGGQPTGTNTYTNIRNAGLVVQSMSQR